MGKRYKTVMFCYYSTSQARSSIPLKILTLTNLLFGSCRFQIHIISNLGKHVK